MTYKNPDTCTGGEVKRSAGRKHRRRPNPALPEGHCWNFCEGSCPWGAKCKFKHNEVVKKAFMERISSMTPPKQTSISTQTAPASRSVVNKSIMAPARTPKLQPPSNGQSGQYPTPPATPESSNTELNQRGRNRKLNNQKSKDQKFNTQKLDNQDSNNQKWGNQKWSNLKPKSQKGNSQKSNGASPTPPPSPTWGASDAGWNTNSAGVALWNTTNRPEEDDDTWTTSQTCTPADDITARVFSKIYFETVKLPHLTTKTRTSRNNQDQPLFEIAQAALLFAQKHGITNGLDILDPSFTGDTSILVKAAEGYANALKGMKVPDVLKKRERAHLDVIIASQYWDEGTSTTEGPSTTSVCDASSSITKPSGALNAIQQSSTKTWEQSDYWAWAKRNLTNATAIKLARTYCQGLENGTGPRKMFSGMGKQAPPGTTFHYFSLLPYEIREDIWLYALSMEKNDVRLIWMYETGDNGHCTNTSFVNANQQQRLLLVNHELRDLALKHNYKLAFGTKHSRPQTYFDYSRDRLFLHTRHSNELPALVKYLHPRERDRILTLAVPLRDFVTGDEHSNAEALGKFRSVKRIHLVCGDGLEDRTYAGAGDKGLAKAIQRMLYDTWRRTDDPGSWPRVRMNTIPALTAKYFGIDDMADSMRYG